jgi:hypothetical protein
MNNDYAATNACDLLSVGIEVNAEIARDEPQMAGGCDIALSRLVQKHGPVALLEALHDAAWGAAESNEEGDEVTCLRLRIFGKRLGQALAALK